MAICYPDKVQKAVDALLNRPAQCSPSLRRSVEGFAAILSGRGGTVPELPEVLADYVRKVALYAYRTTDEDFARLQEAGYSQEQVFEITLCASVGAGLGRMERGLAALEASR